MMRPNDILPSIALELDISLFELMQANSSDAMTLCPDESSHMPNQERIFQLRPIDSQIFNRSPAIDGVLLLTDESIRFEPYRYRKAPKPIKLNLLGYVQSVIRPHPCEVLMDEILSQDSLAILRVSLLREIVGTEIVVYEFAARLSELTPFQALLESRARAIQAAHNFMPSIHVLRKPREAIAPPVLSMIESTILTPSETGQIHGALPLRFKRYGWQVLYRSSCDGCSYTALSSAVRKRIGVLLVLKTSLGDKIGVFVTNEIGLNPRNLPTAGDAFVFSFTAGFGVYRWSRTAPFFVTANEGELAVGGNGSAAIWIDGELLHAFSERCTVFNSPVLSSHPQFDVYEIEAWHIGH
jgi:hypothetical protein